ncbi:hypothetical protein L799_08815 [Enterobacter roggenkampii EC_38VIM1]|uniref:hypothetical protein n=1 Tax=Enterobacter roggenkampii TaxID=1812935 RepID=UPI000385E722|nr:hypothetical protein L799_08815 [Enterobacter roggenkampii EC_38VIM1]CAH5462591.1 hypothetical protein AI2941V1_0263 [Enterobacter cloacae]
MKRSDADAASQRSYSSAETRNTVSHIQAAESLHEISLKTPTLRDYFAAKAMQGIISSDCNYGAFSDLASDAYSIADAMLKAREE